MPPDPSDDLFEISVRRGANTGRAPTYVVEAAFRGQRESGRTEFPGELQQAVDQLQVALQVGMRIRGATVAGERPSSEPQILREIGTRLFDMLFRGDVARLYAEARATTRNQGFRLLVRMNDEMRELGSLPWETLYDVGNKNFLAITDRIGVARTANDMLPLVEPTRKLRVLCVIADAVEEDNPTPDPMLFERESRQIQAAMEGMQAPDRVHLRIVRGTYDAVEEELVEPRYGGWDVFHFIGHGGFDPLRGEAGEGYLVFVRGGSSSAPERIYAEDLKALLDVNGGPRLVVLNACDGFRASSKDIFASIGGYLAFADIPFVVGMQFVISDEAALLFSQRFYDRLVRSDSIYRAMWYARLGLKRIGPEWVTPVLFSRSTTGVVCDLSEGAAP